MTNAITVQALAAYRDWVVDGVPSTGKNRPDKPEIRAVWTALGTVLDALTGGGSGYFGFTTLASLNSSLAYPANTLGEVLSDPTPANNGLYLKSGAPGSGSWSHVSNLSLTSLNAAIALLAPLASPAFTGAPTVPNQPALSNSSVAANTAYADSAVAVELSRAQTVESDIRDPQDISSRAGAAEFLWSHHDNAGAVAYGIRPDGSFYAGRPEINAAAVKGRSAVRFVDAIFDNIGSASFGVEPDGTIWLVPSKRGARDVGAALTGFAMAGISNVCNVRPGPPGVMLGSVRESDGVVSDIAQRLEGPTQYAMVWPPGGAALPTDLTIGQSTAGGGGGGATVFNPILSSALFPFHVLMSNSGGSNQYGTTVSNLSLIADDIAPMQDWLGSPPQFLSTVTQFALEQFMRDDGIGSPGVFSRTDWYGGQPLTTFEAGTQTYNNMLVSAAAGLALAKKYGRGGYVRTVRMSQGQNGPGPQATYYALLASFVTSARSDISAATGQSVAPFFSFVQIAAQDTDNYSVGTQGAEMAQVQYAQANTGNRVALCGTMYMAPIGDIIHPMPLGQMMIGELFALAELTGAVNGLTYTPLWLLSGGATLSGSTITLNFSAPTEGAPIEFDLDWIKPPAEGNYGFRYTDSASHTISSVAITGANQITITLSGSATSSTGRTLYYAQCPATNDVSDNWSASRGQVMSRTSRRSLYNRLGFSVPETVRHYLCRFTATF